MGRLAQWIARQPSELKVVGSSPTLIEPVYFYFLSILNNKFLDFSIPHLIFSIPLVLFTLFPRKFRLSICPNFAATPTFIGRLVNQSELRVNASSKM
jgi:hypothetical protein